MCVVKWYITCKTFEKRKCFAQESILDTGNMKNNVNVSRTQMRSNVLDSRRHLRQLRANTFKFYYYTRSFNT